MPLASRGTRVKGVVALSRARIQGVVAFMAMLALAASAAGQAPLIAFDHYHTVEEIEAYLETTAARHEALVTLVQIGESRGGRRILAVEINNATTGTID